jgi:tRNA(Ile)-lysidine synthase TilS/MesJ
MQMLQAHPLLSKMQVCRPLLRITKPQLIAFCNQFTITFFEDETNADVRTSQRNFLRHEIIEKFVGMNDRKSRFLESMKQVYQEIESLSAHITPICMTKVPVFPSWNAEYAYLILSTDILNIWNTLGIATNLRSAQIAERTKRLTKTQS